MRGGWRRREALAAGLAVPAWAGVARGAWAQAIPAPATSTPQASAPDPTAPAEAAAAPPPPQTLDDLVTLDMAEDGVGRMTVPAMVNGRGPFPFMVDTGADRSVLSEELATLLALPEAGLVRVNGIAGSQVRPRAQVARLEVGGRKLDDAPLALLPRRFMGALGFIGLDALRDQRLAIDFTKRRMQVRRSRGWNDEPGEIVVYGSSRFGQLMLVDSTVRRKPIYVILDSGAQDTIGNPALRDFLAARRRAAAQTVVAAGQPALGDGPVVELASVTGQTTTGVDAEVADLTLGGIFMRRVPVIYSDLHTFHMFKLDNQPALMLGMDTLRSFAGVTVDFGRREVGFRLPGTQAA